MTKNVQFLKDSLLEIETDYSHLSNLKEEMDNGSKEIVAILEDREQESISILIDVSFLKDEVTYIH